MATTKSSIAPKKASFPLGFDSNVLCQEDKQEKFSQIDYLSSQSLCVT